MKYLLTAVMFLALAACSINITIGPQQYPKAMIAANVACVQYGGPRTIFATDVRDYGEGKQQTVQAFCTDGTEVRKVVRY